MRVSDSLQGWYHAVRGGKLARDARLSHGGTANIDEAVDVIVQAPTLTSTLAMPMTRKNGIIKSFYRLQRCSALEGTAELRGQCAATSPRSRASCG